MEKIDSSKAILLSKNLRDSYFANPFYLTCYGYQEERNGEELIFEKDIFTGNFVCLFTPKNPENLQNIRLSFVTEEELNWIQKQKINIKDIKKSERREYIYKTQNLIDLKGKEFKSFRNRVNQFKKYYPQVEITNECEDGLYTDFIHDWVKKQKFKNELFEEYCYRYSLKSVELRHCIPSKEIFIFDNNKLIGYSSSYLKNNNFWIGVNQKADYNYRGLNRFLYHERAKLSAGVENFSIGTGVNDPGIKKFKEELLPIKYITYWSIIIN